jgi:outer membrane protein OmpA-like peptidoglycan-associated protein
MQRSLTFLILAAGLSAGCQTPQPRSDSGPSGAAPGTRGATTASLLPQTTFKTFPIYTDLAPRHTHYAPSGYMGDSDLTMSGAYVQTPHGEGPCLRISYKASGVKGWSGIYWQDPANNWGDVPGRAGFDLRGAKRLTFWARGENGGERIHEFRMGGIVGQYPDSDIASITNIKLSKEWKKYTIDLDKKDLRHIIGGFGFLVNKADNPGGMVFYLDDIIYEGPGGSPKAEELRATAGPVTSQTAQTVATSTPTPTEMPAAASAPTSTKDLMVKSVEGGLRVSFSSQFLFAPGRSNLESGSGRILNQLIGLLSAYPSSSVLIEGHTDGTGNPQFNLKLSELRAVSVRDYLIKQGGFDGSRFRVTGYGATRPVADNKSQSGRAQNRRVEVTILKSSNT